MPANVPVLTRRNKNRVYSILLKAARCGPFDGGCLIFAQALKLKFGGEIWVILGKTQEAAPEAAQHAVVRIEDDFIDADGRSKMCTVMSRFARNEHVEISGAKVIRPGDLLEATRSPVTARKIAALLTE
jgi:hypothetical protein